MKKILQIILSIVAVIALIGGGYYIFKNYICKDTEDDFDEFEDEFDDFDTEEDDSFEDEKDSREYVTLNPSDSTEEINTKNAVDNEETEDEFLYE